MYSYNVTFIDFFAEIQKFLVFCQFFSANCIKLLYIYNFQTTKKQISSIGILHRNSVLM